MVDFHFRQSIITALRRLCWGNSRLEKGGGTGKMVLQYFFYNVPGTVPSSLHVSIHVMFTTAL